jgi:peptidoglycan hydrolase-like protein with peptidoglycan-binding domain
MWGPQTQAAVERYQQSRAIGERVEPAGAAPPRLVVLADPTDVRTIQNRLRQLGCDGGPAHGVWSPGTQAAMENFQRARPARRRDRHRDDLGNGAGSRQLPARGAAIVVIREPLEPGVIRGIQQRLRQHGYYHGRIDGLWGPATERGLVQFQRSHGLEPSGHLTPTTAPAPRLDPNNLSSSAVPPR